MLGKSLAEERIREFGLPFASEGAGQSASELS
jgi:hypothetical protein